MTAVIEWTDTHVWHSTASPTFTLKQTPLAGDMLIGLAVLKSGSATPISATQTGATWLPPSDVVNTGPSPDLRTGLWYTTAILSTVTTSVQFQFLTSCSGNMTFACLRGVDTSLQVTTLDTGGSIYPFAGNLTTTLAKQFIIAGFGIEGENAVARERQGFGRLAANEGDSTTGVSSFLEFRRTRNIETASPGLVLQASASWAGRALAFNELTLTSATWKRAMTRATVTPRVLCEITTAINTTVLFTDGISRIPNSTPSMHLSGAVQRQLDLAGGSSQVETISLTFILDGAMRTLITGTPLPGARCRLFLGEQSLSRPDYAPLFAGIISEVLPTPTSVTIKVKSTELLLKSQSVTGYWINQHPYEVMYNALYDSGISTELWDQTSLYPGADADISHLVAQEGDQDVNSVERDGRNPKVLKDLLDETARLVFGVFATQEDGMLRFIRVPTNTAAIHTWTEDDLDVVEQDSVFGEHYTRVLLQTHPSTPVDSGTSKSLHTLVRDTAAETRYALKTFDASTDTAREKSITLNQVNAITTLIDDFSNSDTSLYCAGDAFSQMSGTRWPGFAVFTAIRPTQPADAMLSNSRTAFLAIGNTVSVDVPVPSEVIEVKALDTNDALALVFAGVEAMESVIDTEQIVHKPGGGLFTVKTRGMFGTSAQNHSSGTQVRDITAGVLLARDILARYANGGWVLKCTTGLVEYDVQRGDVVSLVTRRFAAYGADGLDTAVTWVVTGKNVHLDAEPPVIEWTLQFLAHSSPPTATLSHVVRLVPATNQASGDRQTAAEREDVVSKFVVSGFAFAATAALTGTLAIGVATCGTMTLRMGQEVDITFPINKDCYLGVDFGGLGILTKEVSHGASVTWGPRQLAIWKIVTGASSITTSTDLRGFQGVHGTKLISASVGPIHADPHPQRFDVLSNPTMDTWTYPNAQLTTPPDNWHIYTLSGTTLTNVDTYWGNGGSNYVYFDSSVVEGGEYSTSFLQHGTVYYLLSEAITVVHGEIYQVTAAVKSETGGGGAPLYIGAAILGAGEVVGSTSSTNPALTNDGLWHRITRRIYCSSGTRYLRFFVGRKGDGGGDTGYVYVDSISVKRIPDAFNGGKTSTQSIPASTETVLTQNAGGSAYYAYSPAYSANTGNFAPYVTNRWQFSGSCALSNLAAGKYARLGISINGTVQYWSPYTTDPGDGSGVTLMTIITPIIEITDQDYVELKVWHNDTVARSTSGSELTDWFHGQSFL